MEIYPGSKLRHFREIHRRTGIPYEQMVSICPSPSPPPFLFLSLPSSSPLIHLESRIEKEKILTISYSSMMNIEILKWRV
jgi:hypothetical protein